MARGAENTSFSLEDLLSLVPDSSLEQLRGAARPFLNDGISIRAVIGAAVGSSSEVSTIPNGLRNAAQRSMALLAQAHAEYAARMPPLTLEAVQEGEVTRTIIFVKSLAGWGVQT
jgi:hypothetical protein